MIPNSNKSTLILIGIVIIISIIYFALFNISPSTIDRKINKYEKNDVGAGLASAQTTNITIPIELFMQDINLFFNTYGINQVEANIRKLNENNMKIIIIEPMYKELGIEKYYIYKDEIIAFVVDDKENKTKTIYYFKDASIFAINVQKEENGKLLKETKKISSKDSRVKFLTDKIKENYNKF